MVGVKAHTVVPSCLRSKKLLVVNAHTVGPSYLRSAGASTVDPSCRFSPIIVDPSPFAVATAARKLRRHEFSPEEFADMKRRQRNQRLREKRQRNKELLNQTARGNVARIDLPEAEEASKGIPYEITLSNTSPDSRLTFLPVVEVRNMTSDPLRRLREVEKSVVAVLRGTTAPHKLAGNQGYSIGLIAVSGGVHKRGGKNPAPYT